MGTQLYAHSNRISREGSNLPEFEKQFVFPIEGIQEYLRQWAHKWVAARRLTSEVEGYGPRLGRKLPGDVKQAGSPPLNTDCPAQGHAVPEPYAVIEEFGAERKPAYGGPGQFFSGHVIVEDVEGVRTEYGLRPQKLQVFGNPVGELRKFLPARAGETAVPSIEKIEPIP